MKSLQDILTESLLDIDNDTGLDDRMVVSQFFASVESQQSVVDHIQRLIEASGEPSISFTSVKNDLWSNNMYVVFPKKQTPNGYRIIIIKRGKHGFQMWSAYADTILDQTMVSAGEAKYICGAKSNLIYKVPSSMYKLFDTIVHKKINDKLGIKESLLDDEDDIVNQAFFVDLKGIFDSPEQFNDKIYVLKNLLGRKLPKSRQRGWMVGLNFGWDCNTLLVTDGETNIWTVSAIRRENELYTTHEITNKGVISSEVLKCDEVYSIPAKLEQLKAEISRLKFKVVQKI